MNVHKIPAGAAGGLGEALSALVSKVDVWRQQRAGIVKELQTLAVLMKSVLDELGNAVDPAVAGRRVPGRRKGYKASEATRAKLRAAWKARKASVTRPNRKRISAPTKRTPRKH